MRIVTILNLLQEQEVMMADLMRSEGKIWVVIGVVCIITLGLFAYLISLDRKVSKLERNNNKR